MRSLLEIEGFDEGTMGMAAPADCDGSTDQWVDARPFRAQLRYLMACGSLTVDDVAAVAGISAQVAERLLHGRDGRPLRRISPDTARRLIQISDQHVRALRRIQVPAAPARLQLRRLQRAGWDDPLIADRVRVTAPELAELAAGAETCSLLLTVRLTAAARAEDSAHCRRRLAMLPLNLLPPSHAA